MLTVIIVIVLAVAGYFLYKKYRTSNATEESLVKETLKNIDAKPSVPEDLAAKLAASEVQASLKSTEVKQEIEEPVEESYEITEEEFQAEVAAGSTEVVTEESKDAKPVRKKKRRYYPKK